MQIHSLNVELLFVGERDDPTVKIHRRSTYDQRDKNEWHHDSVQRLIPLDFMAVSSNCIDILAVTKRLASSIATGMINLIISGMK